MNALGHTAAAPGAAAEEACGPESGVGRRTVLVAMHRGIPHEGALAMGRVIAGALRAPLHGVVLAREPIEPAEAAEHVGLSTEAVRGVVMDVAQGEPHEALDAALVAHGAGYLVVSAAPEAACGGPFGMCALAERALATHGCGVVLVGSAASAPSLQRILLPIDGTPSTAAAITPVGQLARSLDALLDIVLVGEEHPHLAGLTPAAPPSEPGAMLPPRYVDQPHHEWPAFSQEFLERFVGTLGHCPADVRTRFHLAAGEPAAEILRLAGDLASDLLVLVWHGELNDVHGCVFRDIVRDAPCPVMVLRR
jgi:nucleotide-binding universal stress UspA family protein